VIETVEGLLPRYRKKNWRRRSGKRQRETEGWYLIPGLTRVSGEEEGRAESMVGLALKEKKPEKGDTSLEWNERQLAETFNGATTIHGKSERLGGRGYGGGLAQAFRKGLKTVSEDAVQTAQREREKG